MRSSIEANGPSGTPSRRAAAAGRTASLCPRRRSRPGLRRPGDRSPASSALSPYLLTDYILIQLLSIIKRGAATRATGGKVWEYRRLILAAAASALAFAAALPADADPFKLKIACTATSDCASAMVARDQGIFAKNGLDADVSLIAINTTFPRRLSPTRSRSADRPPPSFCRPSTAGSISSRSPAPRSWTRSPPERSLQSRAMA